MAQPQNVALEAIFAEDNEPATMFGIRVTSLPKPDQAKRITAVLKQTRAIETESDFHSIADTIFPEFDLFSQPLKALNIGIVSQWYSFGPETIWTPGTDPLSVEALRSKAPRFFEATPNPAAVEFWYTQPTDHWYKIYVSEAQGGSYGFSPVRYQAALSRLAEFVS